MDAAHIPPRVLDVIRDVARTHNVSVDSVLSPSRLKRFVVPRQQAMWRVRAMRWPVIRGHPSYPQIGRWFNRDHTTILHAVRKVSEEVCLAPEDVAA